MTLRRALLAAGRADGCRVSYRVAAHWLGGFVG
jgi:hypothetical protein